ncbi:DMT family transporter [Luteimonas terricola]|uniref:Membrane protein n=1 Tax=Luteimonas terricola TaxID=645597 RepID=A0ABQ2E7C2_9GAMM|nr:multidrug resistance efflux transporter family protein [Luteimonas terricola]GGJ95797.1 membrane protein [Luteimonas terricola]
MSRDVLTPGRALAAVGIALCAALFFTFTYVLNRVAADQATHWAWIASLRYLFTLPLMLVLMPFQGGMKPVLRAIAAHPWPWLRSSLIGFGLFYCMLSFAAASGPSWLVAGTFQFTVIAGILCAPFLYSDARRRIPRAGLAVAALIFAGVLLMQFGHASGALDAAGWIALVCLLVAAFAFPLGNRMLLLHLEGTGEALNATQRVFGMTLASQPLWILLAVYAGAMHGLPTASQLLLGAAVALFAGVIAMVLFFQATGMVRNHPLALGAAEAMQGSEVVFAMLLGVLLLGEDWPRGMALGGAALVVLGIVAFAWVVARPAAGSERATRVLRTDKGA